jgi:hypothetical protein
MSDQRMNASDQGSQPDSGSAPNDQVSIDAQGSNRNKGGQGTRPQGSSDLGVGGESSLNDVTEQAHKHGQKDDKGNKS